MGFKVLPGIPQGPLAGRAPRSWKHRLHPVPIGKTLSPFSAFSQLRNAKNYLESLASSTLVKWETCLSHPAETRLLPFDPAAECPEPLFERKSVAIISSYDKWKDPELYSHCLSRNPANDGGCQPFRSLLQSFFNSSLPSELEGCTTPPRASLLGMPLAILLHLVNLVLPQSLGMSRTFCSGIGCFEGYLFCSLFLKPPPSHLFSQRRVSVAMNWLTGTPRAFTIPNQKRNHHGITNW